MYGVLYLLCISGLIKLSQSQSITEFNDFVGKYNKQYSSDEFDLRYDIFRNNLDFIRRYNSKGYSWKLAPNEFTDLTWNEFKRDRMGLFMRQNERVHRLSGVFDTPFGELPEKVDWREKGVVNSVKDQGQCGSCWAFSTVGSIESAYAIKTGKLFSLSEQQLVDCSRSYGNEGCGGGFMDDGFQYVESTGLCLEDDYVYTAEDGTCSDTCKRYVSIRSFVDVPAQNETALTAAVFMQPVSVAIEADTSAFQFYSSGVFDDDSCGTNLDHGVVVVGYGVESGKNYWLVRNSWGSSWGENGYIKISRGNNRCGIAEQPSYPIV